MKKVNKLVSLALALAMCLALAVPAMAVEDKTGYLIYESGEISNTTIEDFDSLIRERNHALLAGNKAAANSIMAQLYEMGGRPSTPEEIASISDSNGVAVTNSNNFHFVTTEYSVNVNNKTYPVRQISCVVMPGCNLYHTGIIGTKRISGNTRAASFNVCKAVGSTVAGAVNPVAGAVLTVYDLVAGFVSDISQNTIIEDIDAGYVYTFLEQCTFYSYKVNNSWTPYAATSFVEFEVDATIMGLYYNGGNFSHIDNRHGTYSGNLYANRSAYNATSQLKTYLNSYLVNYSSQVTGIVLQDTNGSTLLSRGLVSPHNTSEIY